MKFFHLIAFFGYFTTCLGTDVIFGGSVLAYARSDIIFLLDGSDSTGLTSFNKAKEFMKDFIKTFTFGDDKTRLAIIQYSSNGIITEINFQQSTTNNADWIKNAITNIPFRRGTKKTLAGLEAMKKEFSKFPRPHSLRAGVKRTGIILTDGQENEAPPASAQEVDIMFMFDLTGSMWSQINGVKYKALDIVNGVRREYPSAKIRVGFVGYRDRYDRPQFEIRPFGDNINTFRSWLMGVRASGGGDRPENVFGGMEHVKSQSWRAPLTRILVHIADAPDHGDFRNRGSSPRRRANSLLRHLKCSTNVYTYLFIKTHCCFSDLNRMIQAFKEESAHDCNSWSTSASSADNPWFVEQMTSSSSIVNNIVDQTKIAIKKVSYTDISKALNDMDVGIIGVGITPSADRGKLTEIMTGGGREGGRGTDRSGGRRSGGGSAVIIPGAGESLGDSIKERLEETMAAEINFCATNPCKNGGTCSSTGSTFRCNCPSGYLGVTCDDNNECLTGNGGCAHICTNTPGSFKCTCRPGFALNGDGKSCDDVNECKTNNGGCAQNCQNNQGSYTCACRAGFTLNANGKSCDDIDECVTARVCARAHTCTNTVGSYLCSCRAGYILSTDGKNRCDDVNECNNNNGGCQQVCTNSPGSYECSCNEGYDENDDGKTCRDVDECASANGGCMHQCHNSVGSFTCSCNSGYTLDTDGASCNDVNECDTDNGGCMHKCANNPGSYECLCNLGFEIDPANAKKCLALCRSGDTTIANPDDCGSFLNCLFTGTEHENVTLTKCKEGLHYNAARKFCDWPANANCRAKGRRGSEANVCDLGDLMPDPNDCRKFIVCQNGDGTGAKKTCPNGLHFSASKRVCDWPQAAGCEKDDCKTGFEMAEDGKTCQDVDECDAEVDDCEGTCVNTNGSFTCACPATFAVGADGKSCVKDLSCSVNGQFSSHPDCSKYYVCDHGQKVEMSCPAQNHFNAALKVCDFSARAGCKASECTFGQLHPHKTDCGKYVVCYNFDGTGPEMSCPPGLHFNAVIQVCDWPANAKCKMAG